MFAFVGTQYSTIYFIVILVILSLIMCAVLIRAILGPRFTDRLLAANMIGVKAIVAICILTAFLEEGFFADVALVYALLSYLAVIIISKIVVVRERKWKSRNIVKIEIEDRSFEEAEK